MVIRNFSCFIVYTSVHLKHQKRNIMETLTFIFLGSVFAYLIVRLICVEIKLFIIKRKLWDTKKLKKESQSRSTKNGHSYLKQAENH